MSSRSVVPQARNCFAFWTTPRPCVSALSTVPRRRHAASVSTPPSEETLLQRLRSLPVPQLSNTLGLAEEFSATGNKAGQLKSLVDLRAALLQTTKRMRDPNEQHTRTELLDIAGQMKDVLAARFDPHSLLLRQITHSSPPAVLQKVVETESVHPLGSVDQFLVRLGKGRKCYAFFHPLLPEDPLVYINVAFEPRIATSMKEIYIDEAKRVSEEEAKAAIFYSIVTTQPGLKGVDLPHQLIKWTARHLQREYKGLQEFSTLSPIPGFASWLRLSLSSEALLDRKGWLRSELPARVEVVAKELGISTSEPPPQALLEALEHHRWYENERVVAALQPLMLRLCAHYVVTERTDNSSTHVIDRVAHFHLSNGAHVHGINWMADLSPLRLRESASLMANYKYPAPAEVTDAALSPYRKEGVVKVSATVETLLRDRW